MAVEMRRKISYSGALTLYVCFCMWFEISGVMSFTIPS
jgi:hypothetical protein